jgi:hypothetical protein
MRLLLAILLMSIAAEPVCADVISALEVQTIQFTGTQNTNLASDGVTGWAFTATESFRISAFGYYDHAQDGLVDSHDIGLWHINGAATTLLATATISSGTAATLNGDFRYSSIAALDIVAGQDYIIGGTIGFGSGVAQYDPTVTPTAAGWTTASQITDVAGRFGNIFPAGSGFNNSNFPSDFGGPSDPPTLGPNFLISSVPEPDALFLIAGCIGGMAFLRRKKTKLAIVN